MFGSNSFSWFKSSSRDSSQYPTWDANSVTMQQPSSPFPPTTQNVVTEQPTRQEDMKVNLRGGAGAGDICCGVCAGLMCFECCEDCC